ncbi:MFS transporter [Asticcacaulis sp. AND118]|uniref:AmpG family muropeptide MFS transporter n=1 Tax=Asticcacaulis sp. AND118 TaxID=2840468 RepID=UPI001CFF875A|nr:MFS transporter [Asticcacaulis sp. AND118]UDF03486.1 MFS transporter [Asticcacaulis sp. AND118]
MTETPSAPPEKKTLWQAVRPFLTRTALVMIFLGFSAGLTLSLIFDVLSIWLRTEGLSLEVIAFFSLATFAYSLKFIWAPLIDRVSIPGLTRLLGHRRSWMLVTQGAIMLGLWTISGLNPQDHLSLMAVIAVLLGFLGATQDIVIDAWRIETAGSEGQGVLATAYAWGARVAPFVAGILPLIIAERFGWGPAYALMAALMGIGLLGTVLAREGEHIVRPIDYGDLPPHPLTEALEWGGRVLLMVVAASLMGAGLTANINLFQFVFPSSEAFDAAKAVWTSKQTGIFLQFPAVLVGLGLLFTACLPLPRIPTRPGAYLRQTFVAPMADFISRYENLAVLILATICVYRLADFLLNINGAFYVDLGFELSVIGEVRKVFGVIMTIIGVTAGGLSMTRFGMRSSLIVGAFACSLSNLAYAWLATQGNSIPAFSITLAIDNISGGYAGTVLIAYMSSMISQGYAAPQYALLSSLYALPGKLLASQSGRIVESAAKGADSGGLAAPFMGFFAALPAVSYTKPAETLGVSREALGAGYMLFFTYTALVGLVAVVLALWLIKAGAVKEQGEA